MKGCTRVVFFFKIFLLFGGGWWLAVGLCLSKEILSWDITVNDCDANNLLFVTGCSL